MTAVRVHPLLTLLLGAPLALLACGNAEPRPTKLPDVIRSQPVPEGSGGLGLKGSMFGDSIGSANYGKFNLSNVRGRLPPPVIQRIVRENFAGMRACYEAGLAKTPTLKGKITTRFVIERDGSVSSAQDMHDVPVEAPDPLKANVFGRSEPRFPDAEVVACVVSKFAALKFPEPQGGIVTVVYPIVFSPEEPEPAHGK